MYVPDHFAVTDPAVLFDFIARHSFGLLVSRRDGEPFATHLPLLLDRATNTLVGHVARANPQWRSLAGQTVLVVFSGPHAYVSPSWYESDNVVPTWNYVAVHAYGRAEVFEEPAALLAVVRDSVRTYEASMPRPWDFPDGSQYIERLLKGIVGVRVAVERWEGKWKMSQNHPAERREKVVRALREGGQDEVAALVAATVK